MAEAGLDNSVKIENEHTFRAALQEGINLFLGAGFSVLARDNDGNALPTGTQLANELAQEFNISYANNLTLAQLCTIIKSRQQDEFYTYLRKRFLVSWFDERYSCLEKLNVKTIFTTNVDDLCYKLYAFSDKYYLNDLDIRGPVLGDRGAVDIVTLNGCILDESRAMSFSVEDLATAFRNDSDRWHHVTERLQDSPTLFWGYSMGDSATLEAVSPQTVQGRTHKDKWIVLLDPGSAGEIEYFHALGFQIIQAHTSDFLDYLNSLDIAPRILSRVAGASTRELFPQEAIPQVGTVPVRPIIEFYLGAPPMWHDIFSGQLHRTSHLARIRNAVNSGKPTVGIGIPACGKTTLLMQVAQEIQFSGHKLVLESPTLDKARLIINRLNGDKALIFIDNFTDSVESFNCLIEQPNITVVGFDRDYNFEIVSHRLDRSRCEILDVTELSASDIQEIRSRIPANIRNSFLRSPRVAEGVLPSLFELIEANIVKSSLHERFRSVMSELAREDERLLDLLLVCCYVHSCRTPISMDMLLAFFRGISNSYEDIYGMCERLGAMLSDYSGGLADTEQDHFVPRSVLISEAVIKQARSETLKRVLLRFHRQVSTQRICRYDIFRRQGYDARLIGEAFRNWKEGMDFYDLVYSRNPSPYIRQQGALYLAHKQRFTEAFKWIDDAIMGSAGRVPSIRHSHAIILFNANIDRPETDGTIERTLHQSMRILSDCYSYDQRKTYHALTFTDQALKFCEKYGVDAGRSYLVTAKTWLDEEAKKVPWHRRVKQLSVIVSRKL